MSNRVSIPYSLLKGLAVVAVVAGVVSAVYFVIKKNEDKKKLQQSQ